MEKMEYHFCCVFKIKNTLYITREEYVGGPRRAIFPPKQLDINIGPISLSKEITLALSMYRDSGRVIYADEWEELNRQSLEYFNEKSIASLERKTKDVTISQQMDNGEISLFGPKNQVVTLGIPSEKELGEKVLELLS